VFAQLKTLGLRRSIYLSFSVAVVTVAVGTTLMLNRLVFDALDSALRRRGESLVQVLALELELAVGGNNADLALEELSRSFDPEDGAYAIAMRPDHTILASRLAPAVTAQLDAIVAEHARHEGGPQGPALVSGQTASFRGEGVLGFTAQVRPLARGVPGELRRPEGQVLLGLSTAPLDRRLNQLRLAMGLVLVGATAIFAGLGWALSARLLFRPIGEMRAAAQRLSESDLSARAAKHAQDELGDLADSLNRIGENLAATLSRAKGVAEGLEGVISHVRKTGSVVAEGVGTVSARTIDASTSIGRMAESLKGIAHNVEVLSQSAEESSASILEVAATNDEVAENIQSLAASVEETTAAIEQMTYSIKEVAKNVEDLSAAAEETSSSMNEMDVSINQVETNANETAKLSEQAQRDAEMGAEALSRTLEGIHKIKGSSKEAASVIEALGKRIATVGNILDVIDEVAEQTNLLALNAAILAAQSGEHGKGFAVVADEIKDLAERTGASTKEISELIRSVQDESRNAVQAMDRGVKNVEEGVRLGQEAESALKKIQQSSQKSTQMVKAIARATIEQARGSKQVTTAINRIAETVQQIASATAEQARGSEQIMKSAEKMKIITRHVERSSQEQARGSTQITQAIESIREMVTHLARAQQDQTAGSDQVMSAVVQIQRVAEAQTHSVRELEAAIADLDGQAQVLGSEVKRFKT
jgi:methyl-accepting chemotaxis protein